MKLIQAVPLLACYLVFCSCSGENNGGHSHDHPHNHEHNHEHNHSHEGEGGKTPAKKPESKPSEKKNVKLLDSKKFEIHGPGGVHEGETLTPSVLAAKPASYSGKRVLVKGEVSKVCKTKGCWLRVTDGKAEVFIKAACGDWGVPTDCEGRTAIVEGTFSVQTKSVAEQKHLLEDEGKHDEANKITEPKVTIQVDAEGVALAKKTG